MKRWTNTVSVNTSSDGPATKPGKGHSVFHRGAPLGSSVVLSFCLVACSRSAPAPIRPSTAANGNTGVVANSGTTTAVPQPATSQQAAEAAPLPVPSPAAASASPTASVPTVPANTPVRPSAVAVQQVVPAGTSLPVRLSTSLSSKNNNAGDPFRGELASPVRLKQGVVLPAGSTVNGVVTSAKSAGRFKGAASMSLRLVSIVVRGRRYTVQTALVSSETKGKGKRTGALVGGGAGGGALIGGLAGGGKGALLGGLLGAGAGTAGAGLTGNNREITYGAESILTFRLSRSITLGSPASSTDDQP